MTIFFREKKFITLYIVCTLLLALVAITFLAQPKKSEAGWYVTGGVWSQRKAITIQRSKVPSTQTNFPVLVDITDSSLQANAQSNGNDILFTSGDGTTKLSHEIELYTSATGRLTAWVKVPTLSSTQDTVIYMYYGNASAADQSNASAVWDSSFKGVWHLKDGTTLTANDSTSNANNGTLVNTPTATAGQVDGAANFVSGSSQNITVSAISSLGSASTAVLSGWIKRTASSDVIAVGEDGGKGKRFSIRTATGNINFYAEGTSGVDQFGTFALNDTSWHHVVMVYDGTQSTNATRLVGYVDGVVRTLSFTNGTIPATLFTANTFYFGRSPGTFDYSNGSADEVRLTTGATRSADWVTTEYNNQSATSTFYTLSGAQTSEPVKEKVRGGGTITNSNVKIRGSGTGSVKFR